jgi:hypothetical protein
MRRLRAVDGGNGLGKAAWCGGEARWQARYCLCVMRVRFHQRAEVARVRRGGPAAEADNNAARADR